MSEKAKKCGCGYDKPCECQDAELPEYNKYICSIIQWCPDRSRLEAANIGIVVARPETETLVFKIDRELKRVKRFFPNAVIGRVEQAVESVEYLLSEKQELCEWADGEFRRREMVKIYTERGMKCLSEHFNNRIQFSPPNLILMDSKDFKKAFNTLYEKSVDDKYALNELFKNEK